MDREDKGEIELVNLLTHQIVGVVASSKFAPSDSGLLVGLVAL